MTWLLLKPLLVALRSKRVHGDDWNHWWARQFEGYEWLPREIDDFIELGCGPYTNTRLIVRNRTVRRIVCSDPLIRTYARFKGRWLAEAFRRGLVLIDDHPMEECAFAPGMFDVVVVINVLDHVYDADLCLEKATSLVRPGGYLVIGQDLSNEEEDRQELEHDVGHPIRLTKEDVDAHLGEFDVVLRKTLAREEGRNPRAHYSTLVFAGRKRMPSTDARA